MKQCSRTGNRYHDTPTIATARRNCQCVLRGLCVTSTPTNSREPFDRGRFDARLPLPVRFRAFLRSLHRCGCPRNGGVKPPRSGLEPRNAPVSCGRSKGRIAEKLETSLGKRLGNDAYLHANGRAFEQVYKMFNFGACQSFALRHDICGQATAPDQPVVKETFDLHSGHEIDDRRSAAPVSCFALPQDLHDFGNIIQRAVSVRQMWRTR